MVRETFLYITAMMLPRKSSRSRHSMQRKLPRETGVHFRPPGESRGPITRTRSTCTSTPASRRERKSQLLLQTFAISGVIKATEDFSFVSLAGQQEQFQNELCCLQEIGGGILGHLCVLVFCTLYRCQVWCLCFAHCFYLCVESVPAFSLRLRGLSHHVCCAWTTPLVLLNDIV